MRLTLPHFYDFGDDLPHGRLDNAHAWDHLRTQTGPFALAANRQQLIEMLSERPEVAGRARAISELVGGSLASYGVGGGLLEAGLNVPRLLLTDFAPNTVARLRLLFPDAQVVRHDLRIDGPLDADVHLFHRVDTEFTNSEWRSLFEAFRGQRIIFVPGDAETVRSMVLHLLSALRQRHRTRAGLMRTRAAIESLWQNTHRGEAVWLGDTEGWLLEPH